ncbi:FadR/GntR family transcriptional regulator [Vallicoccus soli]|uniref:FadR family transcriptional regulator n=1 Tax=Vallicoccus soli TaxID=2339232 RepID=A0A3A3Z1P2_9ACTN|nr:GntR family transcriptional regulator [Vallicoccus soli]RJK96447.1 FadR family transcriptional regulator [Vallicoccus soli]
MAGSEPFERVRPVRAYERIVEQVEDRVLGGRLLPGERLPSEREMMQQFGVSRSTVREALRVLESGGFVRSRPGDPNGPEVLPFSPASLRKSMTRLVQVDEIGLGDLVHFRMLVEGAANQLAASLATPAQLEAMDAAIAAMAEAVELGYEQFSRADVAFHDAVARASRSTLLQVCSEVVRGAVLGLIAAKIAEAGDRRELMLRSLQHHREVLAAVRARDGARAARLARETVHDYYVGYVPVAERPLLRALLSADGVPSGRSDQ